MASKLSISDWGGEVEVFGRMRRFTYRGRPRALVIEELQDEEARLLLSVLSLSGGVASLRGMQEPTESAPPTEKPQAPAPMVESPRSIAPAEPPEQSKFVAAPEPARTRRTPRAKSDQPQTTPAATESTAPHHAPSPHGRFGRLPNGYINNCAMANGQHESSCQVCGGNCPDRKMFANTGSGHLVAGPIAAEDAPQDAPQPPPAPEPRAATAEAQQGPAAAEQSPLALELAAEQPMPPAIPETPEFQVGENGDPWGLTPPEPKKSRRRQAEPESAAAAPSAPEPAAKPPKYDLEILRNAPRLASVLDHLIRSGYRDPAEMVEVCQSVAGEVPIIGRITNLKDRIDVTLAKMGYPEMWED